MEEKDKKLLLSDLSPRLPYGVKVLNTAEGLNEICILDSIMTSRTHKEHIFVGVTLPDDSIMTGIEMVKPFLRPLLNITDEEKRVLNDFASDMGEKWFNAASNDEKWLATIENNRRSMEYLYSRHIDVNGLIPKGLALEAPDEMYNFKNE